MDDARRERYSRQIRFPGLGEEGQEALVAARVAIIGCGALGGFQTDALARAGVGYLRVIDRDFVEWNNLQRQWLFEEADAHDGLPKAIVAARRLARINSLVEVDPLVADLTSDNAAELLGGVDLLLDGTDNFETRYLINDFAVRRQVPWIYGAAVGSYGITMTVLPGRTACLRCVWPEPPAGVQPTCETAGVLNTVPATIAAWQVSEAIKILSGHPEAVCPGIRSFDLWAGSMQRTESSRPEADCPACGRRQFPHLEGRRRAPISLCGRNAVQIHERARPLDLAALRDRLAPLGDVRANEFALRFFLPPYEMTVFPDGRAIIKGTTDTGVARSLYARYVGG